MAGGAFSADSPSNSAIAALLCGLPEPLLHSIVRRLSFRDLASLVCSCRAMAALSDDLFACVDELDMTQFAWVDPSLCDILLHRLRGATLRRVVFSLGVFTHHSFWCPDAIQRWQMAAKYSPEVESAVLARFPAHAHHLGGSDRLLLNLLYGNSHPRPMDVLVHATWLERLLMCHGRHVEELVVDCDAAVKIWPLKEPVMEMAMVARLCPRLRRYCARSLYHRSIGGSGPGSAWQAAQQPLLLLQHCPRLSVLSSRLVLTKESLPALLSSQRPYALQQASVHVALGGDAHGEGAAASADAEEGEWRQAAGRQLQRLASLLPALRTVHLSYATASCVPLAAALLTHLPQLQSVTIANDPSFLARRAMEYLLHHGPAATAAATPPSHLPRLFQSLPPSVACLNLLSVPHADFDAVFGPAEQALTHLPCTLTHLDVSFVDWPRRSLTEQQQAAVRRALAATGSGGSLASCRVRGSAGLQLKEDSLLFSITIP
ncbi:hypothetical protein CLOM_g16912 [Closterium sp. NIES-68]|nr:hypothetical protein CLOM_g16912 [Closterium sp. NIES-68]GJP81464.1 hypothetical protein CLOP_g11608 [Closterium sp. NIES-67]